MQNIVGVKFKKAGKVYYFDFGEFDIPDNSYVVVETTRGIEFGQVVVPMKQASGEEIVAPLKKVVRIATEEDIAHHNENVIKEKEAFDICTEKIKAHKLDMKLVDVEYTFDNNEVLFYFTADGRVDFRELVRDLAAVFKTRIELRQVGVRDEAKMMGGIGMCGRQLCCKSFLCDFHPVSIKMAKEQGLSLNPSKISGVCGRLMCCLKYEQDSYEELLKKTPGVGAIVKTPDGQGTVEYVILLKQLVKVRLDKEGQTDLKIYNVNEVSIIKNAEVESDMKEEDIEALKELED